MQDERIAPQGRSQPISISWQQPSGLFGFSMMAGLLRILTLGIYTFWAKAELRRRIWSAIRVEGEPLRFTGTGGELFKGFLLAAFGIVMPLGVGLSIALTLLPPESAASVIAVVLFYAIFYFLLGLATFTGQRYRLSRTTWRGLRAGLDGSAINYALTAFGTALLIPLTLGWIIPWRSAKLNGRLTDGMRFGDTHFIFAPSLAPLYRNFAAVWLVLATSLGAAVAIGAAAFTYFGPPTIVTGLDGKPKIVTTDEFKAVMTVLVIAGYLVFSVVSAWYTAVRLRHYARYTHFAGSPFECRITAAGLVWLTITNVAITILSLGFLLPIAQARLSRYVVERLTVTAPVDLAVILKGAETPVRGSEGLSQAFDLSPI